MKKIIKNAYILDMVGEKPNIQKNDILIKDNIIEKIESEIDENEAEEKINAKNMLVMPGLINTHTWIGLKMLYFQ